MEVRKINVSLTQHEVDIVQDLNAENGLNNFSAALRMLIREWKRLAYPEALTSEQDNGHEA